MAYVQTPALPLSIGKQLGILTSLGLHFIICKMRVIIIVFLSSGHCED